MNRDMEIHARTSSTGGPYCYILNGIIKILRMSYLPYSQIAALDFTPMRYVKTGELNRRIIEQWNN